VPEDGLHDDQVVVFQVPTADPLRMVDPRPSVTRQLHAERDYAAVWLYLYEDLARIGKSTFTHSHPVEVEGGYVMSPTPVPRWDLPRLDGAPFLGLYGAGREATVYAVPPHTRVTPLHFEDRPFTVEGFDSPCGLCGATDTYRVQAETGGIICSDTDHCRRRRGARA
jgi:alpha-D-ribose 1-methylphosphonate 5-phosphate C-P lyase